MVFILTKGLVEIFLETMERIPAMANCSGEREKNESRSKLLSNHSQKVMGNFQGDNPAGMMCPYC